MVKDCHGTANALAQHRQDVRAEMAGMEVVLGLHHDVCGCAENEKRALDGLLPAGGQGKASTDGGEASA